MNPVAVIDYGLCNLDSIARAVEECGRSVVVTRNPTDLRTADRLILPGVGAFTKAMANLEQSGLADEIVRQVCGKGIPLLGICLGMQLLAQSSTEGEGAEGLALIDGHVERLAAIGERVPHVGWNVVDHDGGVLFDGIRAGMDFYFVHGYHLRANVEGDVVGTTPFGDGSFVSSVARGNLYGVQFHPEKSQRVGMRLLRNYLEL